MDQRDNNGRLDNLRPETGSPNELTRSLEKSHPADPPGGSRPAGIGGDSFKNSA